MVDNAKEQTLSFALSHEELVALLGILNLPTLPGMESNLVESYMSNDDQRLMVAAGQRSLQARGMVAVLPDQVQVDQMIAGILYACGSSRAMLTVISTPANGQIPDRTLYYIHERLIVEWSNPVIGVHQLRLLPDLKTLASAILVTTDSQGDAPTFEPAVFPLDQLRIYRDAVQSQQSGIEALLQVGASQDIADLIHYLISNLVMTHTILGVDLRSEQGVNKAFNLLHSGGKSWLMQDAGNKQAEVMATDGVHISQAVVQIIRAILPDMFAE